MARVQEKSAKSEAISAPVHPSREPGVQPLVGGVAIRNAVAADLPALRALEALFPGDRLSPRQFRHHLRSTRADLRVLDAGGIAGYSLLLRHRQRPAWRLYSIVVDPQRRGRGFGVRLLQDAIDLASRAGAPALTLEVREDNAAALALYRGCGFAETGKKPGYYEDGAAAVCLMRSLHAPRM